MCIILITEGTYERLDVFCRMQALQQYCRQYRVSDLEFEGQVNSQWKMEQTFDEIKKALDESQILVVDTVRLLLERGEKIDRLVAQSAQLNTQSKAFYKGVKRYYPISIHPNHVSQITGEETEFMLPCNVVPHNYSCWYA